MSIKLKSLFAAFALIAVAGQASAAIQSGSVTPAGSELVFYAWDSTTNTSYEKDLGIVFNTFQPSSTQTSASNFTQSVLGASWNSYLASVGSDLSNTKWGVFGVLVGSSTVNNGQQLLTTVASGSEALANAQKSGNGKGAVTVYNNNIGFVNTATGDATVSNNLDSFSASTGTDNFAFGVQSKAAGKLAFATDNAVGTSSIFDLLSMQSNTNVNAITTTFSNAAGNAVMAFDGSNVSFTTAVAAVPEPSTYAMMLAGLMLVGGIARRRKSSM